MKVGDRVRVNVPDEKWCHGAEGVIESPSSGDGFWWVHLEGIPTHIADDNPFEFHDTELTLIDA